MSNKIILLVGKSGSGKTTICDELQARYGLKSIKSYTTRSKRYEEEDNHIFITEDEASYSLSHENIVGYTEFDGHKYFATSRQVEENDIYVIDKWGVDYFKEHYNGSKKAIVIYLFVPKSLTVLRMMKDRGREEAEHRANIDEVAFNGIDDIADFVIYNINMEKTIDEIMTIFNSD